MLQFPEKLTSNPALPQYRSLQRVPLIFYVSLFLIIFYFLVFFNVFHDAPKQWPPNYFYWKLSPFTRSHFEDNEMSFAPSGSFYTCEGLKYPFCSDGLVASICFSFYFFGASFCYIYTCMYMYNINKIYLLYI